MAVPQGDPVTAAGTQPARVVVAVAAAQVAAGVGFYAVIAHLVLHLRHDLGLLAWSVSVVLTLRTAVQYTLYLPAGAVIDRIGAARAAGLACLVRAGGFAVLAIAADLPMLVLAAVLIGVGGSVYTPAGQAILAGLPGGWPRPGFAWYVTTGQLAAVAGPLFGLALLGGAPTTGRTAGPGFAGIAWSAAALWLAAALLLGVLVMPTALRQPRKVTRRWRAAGRDRDLIRLALAVSPVTLLVTQTAVVVPLIVADSGITSAFLAGAAAMAALAQLPFGRGAAIRYGVVVGFAGIGVGYLALIPAALRMSGWLPTGLVLCGGAVTGLAQGMLQPAVFHRVRALAPAGATGTYFGLLSFVTGMVGLAGGLAIGYAFDAGTVGAVGAVLGLSACAAAAATIATRVRSDPVGLPPIRARTYPGRRGIARRFGLRRPVHGR
jgi:MFS family permease